MKKAKNWVCLLLVMSILGTACLSGCSSKMPAASAAESSSIAASEEDGGRATEPIIRQDAEGLVQVRIEDGQAFIRLEPQRWEDLYGAELAESREMFEGEDAIDFSDPSFFAPINRTDDVPVKEACVGTVPGFSDWSLYSFPIPVAVLLREDGRVEAVFADPFISVYSSEGLLLPFLEDVVSLDVAMSSGDGRGDPSIYATCADGLRYDLQYLFSHTYVDIFDTIWSCEVETANPRQPTLNVQLQFLENNTANLTITDEVGPVADYVGSYEFVLAEDQEYRPPTLLLDLTLGLCYDSAIQARGDIKGAFFYQFGVQDSFMQLWLSFGDALYVDAGGTPMTEYWLSGWGQHDEDYATETDPAFSRLLEGNWVTELEPSDGIRGAYVGVLRFWDEGIAEFLITIDRNEVIDAYMGSYSIVPDEDDPGVSRLLMVFDLALDWTNAEGEGAGFPRREIKGTYVAEMTNLPELYLWLSEGDGLYNNQFNNLDGPKTDYTFAFLPYAVG